MKCHKELYIPSFSHLTLPNTIIVERRIKNEVDLEARKSTSVLKLFFFYMVQFLTISLNTQMRYQNCICCDSKSRSWRKTWREVIVQNNHEKSAQTTINSYKYNELYLLYTVYGLCFRLIRKANWNIFVFRIKPSITKIHS